MLRTFDLLLQIIVISSVFFVSFVQYSIERVTILVVIYTTISQTL